MSEKKERSVKSAYIAAIAAIIVAIITAVAPVIIRLFNNDNKTSPEISIKGSKASTIVTGNNNIITKP